MVLIGLVHVRAILQREKKSAVCVFWSLTSPAPTLGLRDVEMVDWCGHIKIFHFGSPMSA